MSRWYEILLIVRKLKKTRFTSHDLAKRSGITVNEASAWIDKFYRWRYVTFEGKAPVALIKLPAETHSCNEV